MIPSVRANGTPRRFMGATQCVGCYNDYWSGYVFLLFTGLSDLITVRTYKPEVRKRVLASIERVAKGEAIAGGAPKEPLVKVTPAANATYNVPELTKRLVGALRSVLGQTSVVEVEPTMVFEDFGEFNLAGIPSADFWVGAVEPAKYAAAQQSGTDLPQLHSSTWNPDYMPTLKMAMTVETTELLELLGP